MPTNQRLPPEGYEMGPGWEVGGGFECTCKGHWGEECVYRHDPQKRGDKYVAGACHVHAEAMGAIVRKAEAPTTAQMDAAVAFVAGPGIGDDPIAWHGSIDDSKARMYEALAAIKTAAKTPPEQPSGNPGELLCASASCCPNCARNCERRSPAAATRRRPRLTRASAAVTVPTTAARAAGSAWRIDMKRWRRGHHER